MHENGHGASTAETNLPTAPDAEKPAVEVAESRHWHEALEDYVKDAHAEQEDLSLIFIDIDALKAANDELGHAAGNHLIDTVRRLADIIPQNVRNAKPRSTEERSRDAVTLRPYESKPLDEVVPGANVPEAESARLGGDEFGIILPRAGKKVANIVADRLRGALATELEKPENAELANIGVGISLGIASLQPGMTHSDLLRQADRAMYYNKLEQLRALSPEEEESFQKAIIHLEEAGVRPRDVPKYIQMLGASAVVHVIRERDERIAAGQLTLTSPETGQTEETSQSDTQSDS